MKNRIIKYAAIFLSLIMVAAISSTVTLYCAGSADSRDITDEELQILDRYSRLEEVRKIITDGYYVEPDQDTLILGAIDGMLASLEDPYTFYYTVDDMKKRSEASSGEYKGIGVSVTMDGEGYIDAVRVFTDSPADKAGIYAGDKIVAIDGERVDIQTTKDLDEAVDRIRGIGYTDVVITILREGVETDITVTRGDVKINYSRYQMIGDIGYIQLYEFEQSTTAEFEKAKAFCIENDAKGVIIDLRNNPGGLLNSVVQIADELLPEGRIIYTEDRAGNISSNYSSSDYWDIPLVILVNGNSASASEILTASVKEYGRGKIVGTQTFGKGIVQMILPFDDGAGMQYTESRYYTPNGVSIHGVGVEPDVIVEMDDDYDVKIKDVDVENDNQLETAIDELNKLIEEKK